MKDQLIRGLLCNSAVSFYAIQATNLVEEARKVHQASKTCTAALGRVLMGASMMGAMLKSPDDEVSLILKGDGPAGNIVCVGRADSSVKGYIANPQVELEPLRSGKLDVGGAVGHHGRLTVVRDMGLKEPYVGQCQLVSGEIAEDLAMYFTASQQQPSLVYLGVHVRADGSVSAASGVIVQPLPDCPEPIIGLLESRADAIGELTGFVEGGMDLEKAVEFLFGDMEPQIIAQEEPCLRCDCSRRRIERAVISLGKEELQDMIARDHGAEITCHFCNESYRFDEEQLGALLAQAQEVPRE